MPPKPLSQIAGAAKELFEATVGLIYPELCLSCDTRVPSNESNDQLPICNRCHRDLAIAEPDLIVQRLARLPSAKEVFDKVFSLWVFDDGGVIQRLQHRIKYQNQPELGRKVGRHLGRRISGQTAQSAYDFVVPVPLAKTRQLERGYNQSEMIGNGIVEFLDGAQLEPDLLERSRSTRSQTDLSRADRWTNVSDAFELRTDADLANKRILLVDDILTTGATVTAAALPMRQAGAIVDLAVFGIAAV